MSHFAYVQDGIVREVIVAEQDFVDGLPPRPGRWIQTSYNTLHNQHRLGGIPLRGNYAGIGYIYDAEHDVFYPPCPFFGWVLDKDTWSWIPGKPMPKDGKHYAWKETIQDWVEIEFDPVTNLPIIPWIHQ